MRKLRLSRGMLGWLVLVLVGGLSLGCEKTSRDLHLEEPLARQACAKVLDARKAGGKPADLQPEIIASDYGWSAGQKLVSYEFLEGETSDGTNLHIPVQLKIEDEKGTGKTSEAVYTVGTSPVITVVRE